VIRLWTDGSILVNPGGQGGWAFVAEMFGEAFHTAAGNDPSSTNNRMELTAVIEAVEWAVTFQAQAGTLKVPIQRVELISDSQYVVFGITRYRAGWERRDWRRVKNVDLWHRLCDAADRCEQLEFRWVRGHDGAEFNEMADKLAGEAARSVDLAVTRRELDDDEAHLDELAGMVE
jgi:ribonuclease HI